MPEATNVPPSTASLLIAGKIPMGVRLPKPQVPSAEPPVRATEAQVPLAASPVVQAPLSETIEGYIVAYHYAALTNWFYQIHLAAIEQVADDEVVKGILDASYRDFCMLDSRLGALDPKEIQVNQHSPLYEQTRDLWRDCIRDWTAISKPNQPTS
jgi:hypothetical protein